MVAAFDHIAQNYDTSFTYTAVGMAQRKIVWDYLEKILPNEKSLHILELNCGTGEDAIWLAQYNVQLTATDISEKMIAIATEKVATNHKQQAVQTTRMNIMDMNAALNGKKFDIIFSNFGGLNCLSKQEMKTVLQEKIPSILTPNGRIIFVLMTSFCLWETLFFFFKLKWNKAFRRLSKKPLIANLGNNATIKTWYYSPKWIKKNKLNTMKTVAVKPVGFFIPPSYLNNIFTKRPKWFSFLQKAEKKITNKKWLARASDHFLIDLQLTPA